MFNDHSATLFPVVLLFATGVLLGRAMFSPKFVKRDRLSAACPMIALALMQVQNLVEMPHAVRWSIMGISGCLMLVTLVIPVFRKPTTAT